MTELLLQKIGTIIGLDLHYFFRSGKWVLLRYVVISATGLALTVTFTHFADKETFGHYQFALATIGILSIFSLPGLNTASMREAMRGNFGGVKKSIYLSFFLSLLIAVFGAAIGTWMIFLKGNEASGLAILAAALVAPFFYGPNNWYVFYESKLDFKSTTIRIMFSSVIAAIAAIILIIFEREALWIVLAYLGIQSIFGWIYFAEAVRKFTGLARGSVLDIKYGIACTIQKFTATTLNENFPTLMIATAYGFQNLAIFQVAYFCFASLSGLFGAFASTYTPLLFKYGEIRVYRAIFQNLALGITLAFVYLTAVWLLFLPVFGTAYQSSLSIALAFAIFIPFVPVKIFLSSYYSSRNRNSFISATNVFSGLSAGFLLWFFRDANVLFATILSFGIMYLIQVVMPLGDYAFNVSKKTDLI